MSSKEKYLNLFLAEADEKLTELNNALIGLEKDPSSAKLANDAMRASHTIKSSSAAMGFMNISHLSHAMEEAFELARTKHGTISERTMQIFFKCADAISLSVSNIKQNKNEVSTSELIERLRRAQDVKENFTTEKKDELAVDDVGRLASEPISAIKVDVTVLDKLMNLTEELLVERMHLGDIARKADFESEDKNYRDHVGSLKSSSEAFNRLLNELQYNVLEARTVPLMQITDRFPRIVRDIARTVKKQVDFTVEGGDIELDRTIIDRLSEPLLHLVRNAIDHGIKNSGTIHLAARREKDRVVLEIIDDGEGIMWNNVVDSALTKNIINEETASAYKKDIKSAKNDILNLMFHPRLSTSDVVTETSGRGIGLSIVKSVIESLGGTVRVESLDVGNGTKFILTLPLTIAIIQALLVRASSQIFALPFSQVDRSVRVPNSQIKKALDHEVALVDEEDIPVVRLANLIGEPKVKKTSALMSSEERLAPAYLMGAELMVITKDDSDKQAGIVVDEILAEQEIVVKPLTGIMKQSKGFAGITLLGDGRPALILDVSTLL
jgi:two-component system, chemotaxis family, sensor kinase CheA